ncbi:MAG: anaerobic ribonucleoside-triphosphate reductase [Clostridiaceae bacterium]|nr:anaerobic ribonucleoside-triphosphate reductase [Clostridiaceae bacterium]
MTVNVQGGKLDQKEVQAYVDHIQEKNHQKIDELTITVDGDYVDLNYTLVAVPFERIRRITGYLVGTMDRWNDAKLAEEADRVKHSV